MHAHLKALGNEVQGSYYTGGKRQKPHHRDEVGPAKDHFPEGRQQDNLRDESQKQKALENTDVIPFEEAEADDQGLYQAHRAQYADETLPANLIVRLINSLHLEPALNTTAHEKLGMTQPTNQAETPSFEELLALMKIK